MVLEISTRYATYISNAGDKSNFQRPPPNSKGEDGFTTLGVLLCKENTCVGLQYQCEGTPALTYSLQHTIRTRGLHVISHTAWNKQVVSRPTIQRLTATVQHTQGPTCVCTHTHTNTHTSKHTHVHIHTRTYTCAHTQAHRNTHDTHTHTCTHTWLLTF